MLSIERLTKRFGGAEVIRDLTLKVRGGERLVILGPNGAGKTTLLQLIAGEVMPDAGRIVMDGRDITGEPCDIRARAGIARSFQTPALFEAFTIEENLLIAESAQHTRGTRGSDPLRDPETRSRIRDVALQTGLVDLRQSVAAADHGTRRRLDLALAISGRPKLLLLDEPASGFGPDGAKEIHDLISALPRDLTMIVIEHDLDLAFSIADRIVILDAGRISFDGAPTDARPIIQAIYDA